LGRTLSLVLLSTDGRLCTTYDQVPTNFNAEGMSLNVSVAYSTCSLGGGCFEQFLFGEDAQLAPVLVPVTIAAAPTVAEQSPCAVLNTTADAGRKSEEEESDLNQGRGQDLGAVSFDPICVCCVSTQCIR
jgi:hypothetical protein